MDASSAPSSASSASASPRRLPAWAKRIMIYLAIGPVLWVVAILFLQRFALFPRYAIPAGIGYDEPPAEAQVITIDTDAGPVHAWFTPGQGVSADSPGPVVIHAHGNGEIIDGWHDMLQTYRRWGVSTLLIEYRGYGDAPGSPSQDAIVSDFVRFRELIAKRPEVDADRIAYHGFSLGGGVVTQLAAEHPPRALILESTFASIKAIARGYAVPGFMVLDPFDSVAVLPDLDCPVLIVHGRRDRDIPYWHAEALRDAAKNATLITFDAGDHESTPRDADGLYWRSIREILLDSGMLNAQQSID